MRKLSVLFPVLLMVIAYSVEGADDQSDNATLNQARHVFSCSMRFPDMATEWALLWFHFAWSGVMTMFFCLGSWWKIGKIARGAQGRVGNETVAQTEAGKKTMNQIQTKRRRLFNIAFATCACLLLSMVATLSTSAKLEDWTRTADLSLKCMLGETYLSRTWENYGLMPNSGAVDVCTVAQTNALAFSTGRNRCTTSCIWDPAETEDYLWCQPTSYSELTLEEFMEGARIGLAGKFTYYPCDCPCDAMVQIERPNPRSMLVSYLAQSLVTVIVGINVGFRRETLDLWKLFFKKQMRAVGDRARRDASGATSSGGCHDDNLVIVSSSGGSSFS